MRCPVCGKFRAQSYGTHSFRGNPEIKIQYFRCTKPGCGKRWRVKRYFDRFVSPRSDKRCV